MLVATTKLGEISWNVHLIWLIKVSISCNGVTSMLVFHFERTLNFVSLQSSSTAILQEINLFLSDIYFEMKIYFKPRVKIQNKKYNRQHFSWVTHQKKSLLAAQLCQQSQHDTFTDTKVQKHSLTAETLNQNLLAVPLKLSQFTSYQHVLSYLCFHNKTQFTTY